MVRPDSPRVQVQTDYTRLSLKTTNKGLSEETRIERLSKGE